MMTNMTIKISDTEGPSYQPRKFMNAASADGGADGSGIAGRSGQTIEALAASLERDGQLEPILVQPMPKGKYKVIQGHRRIAALLHLKRDTVEARIYVGKDQDAALIAIVAQDARKDLTPYERATYVATVYNDSKKTLSAGKIASALGKSKSHVENMIRVCNEIAPKILKRWEAEAKDDPANGGAGELAKICYTDTLVKWTKLKHTDQLLAFDAAMGKDGEDDTDGKKGKKGKKGKPEKVRTVKAGVIAEALAALKGYDGDLGPEWQAGATAALKWALGKTQKLADAYPRPNEGKDDDTDDTKE